MKNNSLELANDARKLAVEMVYRAHASHIGGALSMCDILAVLYSSVLNYRPEYPDWPERDRFILSKGHSCVALYSILALSGYFPLNKLEEYGNDGTLFLSHTSHFVPGVEVSSGSLGHGLPIACGIALAAQRLQKHYKTYVLVGDGEMDEGSNWESLLLASTHNLSNICLIIDYNKLQGLGFSNQVLRLEPLQSKMEAFNWHVIQVDGHNHEALLNAFDEAKQTKDKPTAIIAHTIKGKGVSFMENELLWHYHSPNETEFFEAIKELEQ